MADAGPIPFQEAIDFFKAKVNLPTERWDDLQHGAHVRAFSVAGMMRDDWLTEIRTAIADAQANGTGLKAFQKTFDDFVDRTGWQFNAQGDTEADRRAWRARIIYKTNMSVAYSAGRYKQMTDPDVLKYRPYWMYKHAHGEKHPRPVHLSWDGTVLLATDPAWKVMYTPNGWGCQCSVIALNRRQLLAMGKTGPDKSPLESYQDTDPRTGQPETRYVGIDRGWEYNPGEEWLNGLVPKELAAPLPAFGTPRAHVDLPELPAPEKVPAAKVLSRDLNPEDYANAFLGEFDLAPDETGFFRDKAGGIVTISQSLFEWRTPEGVVMGFKSAKRDRGVYALLVADAIKNPDEIWIDWASVQSGIVLKRAYLKRVELPDGRTLFVRFEWTKAGWIAKTGFSPDDPNYLDTYRTGALVYRK